MEFQLQWKTLELLEFGICAIGKRNFMNKFVHCIFVYVTFYFNFYVYDTLRLKFAFLDYFFLGASDIGQTIKAGCICLRTLVSYSCLFIGLFLFCFSQFYFICLLI